MAVSNKTWNAGSNAPLNLGIEKSSPKGYTSNSDTVSIVCLLDATVKITGTGTGKQYVFNGAGSVVDVDISDKDEILNKKRGRACCGGESGTSLFALV